MKNELRLYQPLLAASELPLSVALEREPQRLAGDILDAAHGSRIRLPCIIEVQAIPAAAVQKHGSRFARLCGGRGEFEGSAVRPPR